MLFLLFGEYSFEDEFGKELLTLFIGVDGVREILTLILRCKE